MSSKFSLTGISDIALGKDLRQQYQDAATAKNSLTVLNSVSFFLAGVCVLFLVAFQINQSVSLTWFFLSEAVAFMLIPLLARQGFVKTAKIMLIAYADIGIIILSAVFGTEAMIQAFLIPTIGLSVLLFNHKELYLRNAGILLSILSFFILDYIIFETISMSESGFWVIRWSVLAGAFVTTWLIFNTFSEFKETAEEQALQLLEKEKKLNKELNQKQKKLQDYIEELEIAREELQKSSKAKSEFLATMSHEIRTPMNAILGMTHLLKQDNPREDQVEPLNILDFSGKTLLSLIDDILDYSKIEAGKIEFEKIEFKPKKLIGLIAKSFKTTAENKNITLKTKIADDIPEVLVGDAARLTQILNNLVNNALKFTEEGSVHIRAKLIEKGEHTNRLVFEVADTGIGIKEDRLDYIFESFSQAPKNNKRLFEGTGLGLTISKQLTELQGGKILVESTPGKGSTFSVVLDFSVPESQHPNPDLQLIKGRNSSYQKQSLRILLAEDNIVNQKVMQRFLERWNMELVVVENGLEAVKTLKKEHFDIILMDLQMPQMDGYEATQTIRKLDDPGKRNIPIVALTAAALAEVREKVYAAGMTDFVTKPFNPSELKKKLTNLAKKG